ncbi:MAG: putative methyltransferase-domain-containing protein [Benjaminiella poitrasii]|nr:MAG: putative methyltransferase-domain-containing protein [Benjaminiella poitrasii]
MSLTDEEFRAKLEKHFSLYRINLRSPLVSPIAPDQWYRADLLLVNELGLFRRADIEPEGQVIVSCNLLTPNDSNDSITPLNAHDSDWELEIRPCPNFSEGRLSTEAMPVPGFVCSGKGSFEYRVRSKHNSKQPQKKFLCIGATELVNFQKKTMASTVEDLILPLVVGPIEIIPDLRLTSQESADTHLPLELWDFAKIKDMVYDSYRMFSTLSEPPVNVAIHEMWDTGIPGKIWDSALVMLDVIKNMIKLHPDYIGGKHIIDLSAGTGLLGFYLASLMASPESTIQQGRITITELDEAVELINKNIMANKFLLSKEKTQKQASLLQTKSLLWGNTQDAESCGKAEMIIASDVLYEAQFFEDLVKTFVDLSTHQTRIYIGYKRRGFDEAEERRFWSLCGEHFDVKLLQYEGANDVDDDLVPKSTLNTGVQLYRLLPHSNLK